MPHYDSYKHHRRSIRLQGFDYRTCGFYFVTMVTKNREHLFGKIEDGKMRLNEFGRIAEHEWFQTIFWRPQIVLDEFVVMPNHFHGILRIISAPSKGVLPYAPTANRSSPTSPSQALGSIVRGFKSSVTQQINQIRNSPCDAVWLRNYYERIIRNNVELHQIRYYIRENSRHWENDPENQPCHFPKTGL